MGIDASSGNSPFAIVNYVRNFMHMIFRDQLLMCICRKIK